MRLRKTNPGDLPQLKALWALGFGDTEQEIEAFFAISYPTATGLQKRTARSLPPPTPCRRSLRGAKKAAARPICMP